MSKNQAQAALEFWFDELTDEGICKEEVSARWFKKDATFDRAIAERFAWIHAHLLSSPTRDQRPSWVRGPDGLLAAVLVLDQFSRNMYRDSPAMFAADPLAQALCLEIVGLGYDRDMPAPYTTFAYMPLMHSERLEDQERCVALFSDLHKRLDGKAQKVVSFNLDFAEQHRDIVRRFGRFPHRNEILGRESSEEELSFLRQPGSSF